MMYSDRVEINSIHSYPQYQMGVRSQLYAPAALPLRKEPPGLGGRHSPLAALSERYRNPSMRRSLSQRVAPGVAAKADGRLFNCQWWLVPEPAKCTHRKLMCAFGGGGGGECDIPFCLVHRCSSTEVRTVKVSASLLLCLARGLP